MKLQLAYNILIATIVASSSINGDDVQHTRKLSSLKDVVGSGCANHVDLRARFLTTAGEECNACSLCSENNINQIFIPKAKDICIKCSDEKGSCDTFELITVFDEEWSMKVVTLKASDMDSEYDPQEATFLGSNDGKDWIEITSTKVEFKKRTDVLEILLENDIAFTHYAMQLKGLDKMKYIGKYGIVESYTRSCSAQLHEKITGLSIPYYKTMAPTNLPSNSPSDSQGFTNKQELKIAIDLWQTNENSASSQYGEIENWDVSRITDMISLFHGGYESWKKDSHNTCQTFNGDLSEWDVSGVTDMSGMFNHCNAFNADLSRWNVAKVKSMHTMFSNAFAFNSNISDWNISNATSMTHMFHGCKVFNADLSRWDVSAGIRMDGMFINAYAFNSNISDWNISNATNMGGFFNGCKVFNADLSRWDVSAGISMGSMFNSAFAFNSNISDWNTSNATNMNGMFTDARAFDKVLCWDVSRINNWSTTYKDQMFKGSKGSLSPNYPNC